MPLVEFNHCRRWQHLHFQPLEQIAVGVVVVVVVVIVVVVVVVVVIVALAFRVSHTRRRQRRRRSRCAVCTGRRRRRRELFDRTVGQYHDLVDVVRQSMQQILKVCINDELLGRCRLTAHRTPKAHVAALKRNIARRIEALQMQTSCASHGHSKLRKVNVAKIVDSNSRRITTPEQNKKQIYSRVATRSDRATTRAWRLPAAQRRRRRRQTMRPHARAHATVAPPHYSSHWLSM